MSIRCNATAVTRGEGRRHERYRKLPGQRPQAYLSLGRGVSEEDDTVRRQEIRDRCLQLMHGSGSIYDGITENIMSDSVDSSIVK